jgi:anti-sigma factor RsiW
MASLSLEDFQDKATQIPFLLNGTLPDAEVNALQQALATEPALARELELQRKIRDAVNASAEVPRRSTLPQFLNRLAAESQREVNAATGNVKTFERKIEPIAAATLRNRGWKMAFAVAAGIVAVQAAMLIPLLTAPDASLVPLSGVSSTASANLQIVFKTDATEKQIRELLRANGAEVVAGPSALGVYQVRAVDTTKAVPALSAASSVVESATVIGK